METGTRITAGELSHSTRMRRCSQSPPVRFINETCGNPDRPDGRFAVKTFILPYCPPVPFNLLRSDDTDAPASAAPMEGLRQLLGVKQESHDYARPASKRSHRTRISTGCSSSLASSLYLLRGRLRSAQGVASKRNSTLCRDQLFRPALHARKIAFDHVFQTVRLMRPWAV